MTDISINKLIHIKPSEILEGLDASKQRELLLDIGSEISYSVLSDVLCEVLRDIDSRQVISDLVNDFGTSEFDSLCDEMNSYCSSTFAEAVTTLGYTIIDDFDTYLVKGTAKARDVADFAESIGAELEVASALFNRQHVEDIDALAAAIDDNKAIAFCKHVLPQLSDGVLASLGLVRQENQAPVLFSTKDYDIEFTLKPKVTKTTEAA